VFKESRRKWEIYMQSQLEKYLHYLDEKGIKQVYIDTLDWRIKHIYDTLLK